METKTPPDQLNPALRLAQVLAEEFRVLHGEELSSSADASLQSTWTAVHNLPKKQAALCISGGGIRSATFGLGILQGLARCGLIDKFQYLSTVSGGGYIGSWLTAWIKRGSGLKEVIDQLAGRHSSVWPNAEAKEIQNLRNYSNYLSPRLGLLSADSWTLIAAYLRNVLLNWSIIIPLLGAVLTLPWIYTAILMMNPPPYTYLPLWLGAICIVIGVAYMGFNLPCGRNARGTQNQFLLLCLLPLFLGSALMTMHWAWFNYYGRRLLAWPLFGMGESHSWVPFLYLGILLHLLSWFASLLPAHGFRLFEFIAVIISGAIGGVLLWFGARELFPQPIARMELYTCFAVPLFMALFFLAIAAFAGISSRWTMDPDREWWSRAIGWLLALAGGWTIMSSLVVFGPFVLKWLLSGTISALSTVTVGGAAGALTLLAGRSKAVPATEEQKATAGPLGLLLSRLATIGAVICIAALLILITEGCTLLMQYLGKVWNFAWNLETVSHVLGRPVTYLNVILYTPLYAVIGLTITLFLSGIALAGLINPNKFSLHATYRDRLIRAYLGASNPDRDPNPFTGFDEDDNIAMAQAWDRTKNQGKLLPVVNIALNLVAGKNLAWQDRKAASFTVSPLHCGSPLVGYRRTFTEPGRSYGSRDGISLGTAVTISGAAASPNMGYHSSPLVTFILTLLNVRLGAWLGNPGEAGDDTFYLGYPRLSVRPIIAEAFGLTNDTSPYVYLSDGGHFDNLGLYEMVLRRCHFIVVSDAGEDPQCSFADLGDAVRKIRIDFGISIEFDTLCIYPRSDDPDLNAKGRNCAIGRIRYSMADGEKAPDGVLVYIKPACYGEEPRDIYEYFKSSKTFPHESTKDQFFSESQFESYRMLGLYTMQKLCPNEVTDFDDFVKQIRRHHFGESDSP